ncbi:uncharacterized protein LOC117919846 [Vitis riparia]|uniref:uncharacterized protein LOC117919846 n=1 Tax=Vitis riparia TaxID=96939 RepID=UPI00155AA8EE|nr:uncharacterized protein LOC117919846 [Vitis riparia]
MDTSNSQDGYYSDMDESFSFTCCDFSDDEGDDKDDDESYIEIALEPLPTQDDDDLKLRVSFSSSRVPLKELFVDQVPTHQVLLSSDASSSSSLSSSSSSKSRGSELITSGLSGTNSKSNNRTRRVQFSAINRVLNAFVSSSRVPSSEETDRIDENRRLASSESRKASKVTTAINGSITKILIKFRSIKIRPMLTSFVKPRQVKGNKVKSQEMSSTIWSHRKLIKPLDNRTVGEGRGDCRRKKTKTSAAMDINMEAIRGVLEAISSMSIGGRSKQTKTKTKSCPGSIKCSPINERGVADRESRGYTRENSVQAAIAHCKRSFGQAGV